MESKLTDLFLYALKGCVNITLGAIINVLHCTHFRIHQSFITVIIKMSRETIFTLIRWSSIE